MPYWRKVGKGKNVLCKTGRERALEAHTREINSPKNRFPHCVGRDFYEDCLKTLDGVDDYDTIPKTCKICPRFDRDSAVRLLEEAKKKNEKENKQDTETTV